MDLFSEPFSERELKSAAQFRDQIHKEALEELQKHFPQIEASDIADPYPLDAYFRMIWDYPGAWYRIVAIPEREQSRETLVDAIVRETLSRRSRR